MPSSVASIQRLLGLHVLFFLSRNWFQSKHRCLGLKTQSSLLREKYFLRSAGFLS